MYLETETKKSLKLINENGGRKDISSWVTKLLAPVNAFLVMCIGKGWIQTGGNAKESYELGNFRTIL